MGQLLTIQEQIDNLQEEVDYLAKRIQEIENTLKRYQEMLSDTRGRRAILAGRLQALKSNT